MGKRQCGGLNGGVACLQRLNCRTEEDTIWDAWGRGGRGCNCSLNECFVRDGGNGLLYPCIRMPADVVKSQWLPHPAAQEETNRSSMGGCCKYRPDPFSMFKKSISCPQTFCLTNSRRAADEQINWVNSNCSGRLAPQPAGKVVC